MVGWDERFNLVKVNPLATWTDDDIAYYLRDRGLPEHPLWARGYGVDRLRAGHAARSRRARPAARAAGRTRTRRSAGCTAEPRLDPALGESTTFDLPVSTVQPSETGGNEALTVAPALIILGLWVVVLAPGVVRWARVRQPTASIASFHRQLRLLEHTGPKIVEPAYRLGGVDAPVVERVAPSPPVRMPRLVLLPSAATTKESTMRYDDRTTGLRRAATDPRYDDATARDTTAVPDA